MAARIYVVEDHDYMRRMLSKYLSGLSAVELVGTAESAEEALEALARLKNETAVEDETDSAGAPAVESAAAADLVLVDMSLPEMNGTQFVSEVRVRWPKLPCVILSGHGEKSYVERAFEAGAEGYILKGDPYELEEAIEQVLDGKRYTSPALDSSVRGGGGGA
jgi:DNA-binding NarL/FixJ family response regulator